MEIAQLSPAGLIFVKITENTKTLIIIIKSTIISKVLAVENRLIIPTTHIPIKTIGNRYFIMNFHVFQTLKVEFSFKAGIM